MKRPVLLTIDDSPSPLMAQRLEYLRALGIPILWFCRGDHLAERPEVGVQALRDGHTLGNHSWSHPRFSQLTLEEARVEIDRTEEILDEIHLRAGVVRDLRCFRFPYEDRLGSAQHQADLQELLRSRSFEPPRLPSVVHAGFRERDAAQDLAWSFTMDLEDWMLKPSDSPEAAATLRKVLDRLETEVPSRPFGLEVLAGHDHSHTAGQWEAVLIRLMDLDCEFLSPGQARALPG